MSKVVVRMGFRSFLELCGHDGTHGLAPAQAGECSTDHVGRVQARCATAPAEVYTPALRELQSGQCVLTVGDANALAWGALSAPFVWVHGLYIHAPERGVSQSITSKQSSRGRFVQPTIYLTQTSIHGGLGLYTSISLYAAGACPDVFASIVVVCHAACPMVAMLTRSPNRFGD